MFWSVSFLPCVSELLTNVEHSSQLYPYTEDTGILFSARQQNGFVASLADIAWIDRDDEDDEDYFGRRARCVQDSGVSPNTM